MVESLMRESKQYKIYFRICSWLILLIHIEVRFCSITFEVLLFAAMIMKRWRFVFSDGFSFAFLLTCVISEFIFELFIVLPVTEEGYIPLSVHVCLGTFVFINILSNLAMVILKDTTTRKIILPSLLKPGWHFCYVCEANSPPRSFHCDRCKTCILKRDHHCAFAGRCIGLKNFRYFLLFLFYLSLGAMYAMLFNMYFIWDVLGGFSFFSVGAHFVPFIFWILGYLSFRVFICTLMSLLSIIGVLCVTYFFFFHLNQMLHNQTTYEHIENIRDYDLGWKNNLVESLGQQWHMVWFLPFVESPLPSDGLSFLSNNSTASDLLNYNVAGSIRHRHL